MHRCLALLLSLTLLASGVAGAMDVDAEALTGAHVTLADTGHEDDAAGGPCDHCCHGCTHPSAVSADLTLELGGASDGVALRSDARFSSRASAPLLEPPAP